MCPTTFKNVFIKEGKEFRFYLYIYLFFHLFAFCISIAFIKISVVIMQIALAYLAFYSVMTLSKLSSVLYLVVMMLGAIYGLYDMI